jgi:hypothetical protein
MNIPSVMQVSFTWIITGNLLYEFSSLRNTDHYMCEIKNEGMKVEKCVFLQGLT